ncbi:MAG: 5-dehydro-4-deoxy-D-glucuronate isomerase [Epulopiscium sp.]|nr:5-dehydro-4-deoxy-D-glucuronate isomerase [Candidatus Epulonipiscium sp.]
MDIRNATNPKDMKHYDTERLREEYFIDGLFVPGEIKFVYSHVDRIIAGSACPTTEPLNLEQNVNTQKDLGTDFFLQRRELGVINIGEAGIITIDGEKYEMGPRDGIYIGMGNKNIEFSSVDPNKPAKFYINSAPAHKTYPTVKIDISQAEKETLGSQEEANRRTINKYIIPTTVKSCQLTMGMTALEPGSVWNTMPTHTHDRRMEVYLYFDMDEDSVVFHIMGEPDETRHIIMRNEQAVISPSWSIHSGVGTKNYTFIWGMVGENQTFSDMDHVAMKDLK